MVTDEEHCPAREPAAKKRRREPGAARSQAVQTALPLQRTNGSDMTLPESVRATQQRNRHGGARHRRPGTARRPRPRRGRRRPRQRVLMRPGAMGSSKQAPSRSSAAPVRGPTLLSGQTDPRRHEPRSTAGARCQACTGGEMSSLHRRRRSSANSRCRPERAGPGVGADGRRPGISGRVTGSWPRTTERLPSPSARPPSTTCVRAGQAILLAVWLWDCWDCTHGALGSSLPRRVPMPP